MSCIKPTEDPAVYRDYELFVPHDALNMAIGDYDLKFQLKLYDLEGKRFFRQSDWYKFHLSKAVAGSAPERRGDSGVRAEWTSVPGPAGVTIRQIAVGSSTCVYALDTAGTLYRWNGSGWDKKRCCVSQISAGSDGELRGTNPADSLRVLRWDGSNWTSNIPPGMTLVTIGNTNNIWAVDASDQVFRWDGSAWKHVQGSLRSISAGGDGSVWGVDSQGVIYRHN